MNTVQKNNVLTDAKAAILEAEMKISELEPDLGKTLSFKPADIKEFQKMKKIPTLAIDICIGINWIIMPVKQKKQFGDWKQNQDLMKDNIAYEKSLNEAMEDLKLNIDQYIKTNPEYKSRLIELDNILEKHKENPDFTPDCIKKVI